MLNSTTLTDTNQSDFESGTLLNLDTVIESGKVRLGLRPLPQADGGADQVVSEGVAVVLDGSQSSSPDGEELTFLWEQIDGPNVTLYTTDPQKPTFVPPEVVKDTIFRFKVIANDGIANSVPDEVAITVLADNDLPVAVVTEEQIAHEGTLVSLDGSLSYDLNGDSLSFQWVQIDGTTVNLSDSNAPQPTFIVPDILVPELLTFELFVDDGQGMSAPMTTSVLATVDNEAPTSDGGLEQSVDGGALVQLNGEGSSDPNNDLLNYNWVQVSGSNVSLIGANTSEPIFVAPYVTTDELLTFQLTVDDSEFSSDDIVNVTVRAQSSSTVNFNWTITGEGTEVWSDFLWTFKWQNADCGSENNLVLDRDGFYAGTSCGAPWGTSYSQPSNPSGTPVQWTIDPDGSFTLGYPQDHGVHGETWFYVNSAVTISTGCGGDAGDIWVNDAWFHHQNVIELPEAGWYHLEFTAYNQNQSSGFSCTLDFASTVDLMSHDPQVTQALRQTIDSGAAGVSLGDGDLDIGSFSAEPIPQQNGIFLNPNVYTIESDTQDVGLYFADTLIEQTNDGTTSIIAANRQALLPPSIANTVPNEGPVGSEVTISGANFAMSNPAENQVFFNNISASIISVNEDSLVVKVPDAAIDGPITINTPFGSVTSSSDFIVTNQDVSPLATRLSTAASSLTSLRPEPLSASAITAVPLAVSPGRQGMEPELQLNYASSSGNGWAGSGWDLHLSYIERSTRFGRPTYDNGDTFIVTVPGATLNLDNVELIPIGNNEYRAKDEGAFARFVFYETHWEMWDKSGTRYLFGEGSGKATNTLGTYRWYLERIIDTNGNYMDMTYSNDQGATYLYMIDYTGHEPTADPPKHQVRFITEPRSDAVASYEYGSPIVYAQRLSAVEMWADGEFVRKYELDYTNSIASGRSLLSAISEYGGDGITPLPIVRFTYQHQRVGWLLDNSWTLPAEAAFTAGENDNLDNGVRLVDVNGDALVDIVRAVGINAGDEINHKTWLNTGSGWEEETGNWIIPLEMAFIGDTIEPVDRGIRFSDVNGDGLIDLIQGYQTAPETQRVYINSGEEWVEDPLWILPLGANFITDGNGDNGVRLSDVNGDGLSDLVQSYGTDINKHRVWLNDGSAWNLSSWEVPLDAAFLNDEGEPNGVSLVDVNGDGLTDLIQSQGTAVSTHRVWINNNNGWESASNIVPLGTEFVESFNTNLDNGVQFADVNGDSRVDIVQADAGLTGQHRIWLNNGLAWNNPIYDIPLEASFTELEDGSSDNGVRLYDVDGDGLLDILQNDGGDINQNRVWLNSGVAPDLLVEVRNGIGAKATVSYAPSTMYDNTGDDDLPDLPFVIQTAVSVVTHDGLGNSYPVSVTYRNGLYDALDRDYRGFGWVRLTDPEGHYTENWFHQDDVFRGNPERTAIFESDGTIVNEIINTWQSTAPYPESTFVSLSQADTINHDGTISFTTRVRYEYDAYGNITGILNDGDVTSPDDEVYAYTAYIENTTDWLLIYPFENWVEDGTGTVKSRTWLDYDGLPNGQINTGNMTTQRYWLDTGDDPEFSMDYDVYGNPISITDALNYSGTTEYDPIFNTFPITITNPLGHQAITQYDSLTGATTHFTDVNGATTQYIYDQFGTLLSVIQPTDSEPYPTTSYEYDLTSIPLKFTTISRKVFGTNEVIQSIQYNDGLGRALQTIVEGLDGNYIVNKNLIFDSRGQITHELLPYEVVDPIYDPPSLGLPFVQHFYDPLGRKTFVVYPDNSMSERQYDGPTSHFIDEEGNRKTYINDGLGRLIQVNEENNGETYSTIFQYDTFNNLIQTTDDAGNIISITYDSLGRKIGMSDPDMGDWSYTYDANNNLIGQTDAEGETISFAYDELNRLVLKDYPTEPDVINIFDDPNVANSIGRVTEVIDASGSISFEYDVLGRIIQETKIVDGIPYTLNKEYDAFGRLTQLVYPDGELIHYTYDEGGNIESVIGDNGAFITYDDYNIRGQVLQQTFGNGIVTQFTYNDQSTYLERIWTIKEQTTLQDFTYDFDNVGNILSITDAVNLGTQTFAYDDLYRLTEATGVNWSRQYQYDSIGNLIYKSDQGIMNYGENGAGPHALTSTDSQTFIYDNNGSMVSDGNQSLAYDAENRLATVDTGQQTLTFVYNSNGQRVKKIISDGVNATQKIYIGQYFEVDGNITIKHIFAGNNRVASIYSTGHIYYHHSNHLGSSSSVTDENGIQIQQIEYFPYGEVRINNSSTPFDISYKFTGKELDNETNLYYFGARYYSAQMGRFISADKFIPELTDSQSYNRYTYTLNNPLKYTDPTGNEIFSIIFFQQILFAAIAGAALNATLAAFTGGDIGQAALTGAISGAIFGLGSGYILTQQAAGVTLSATQIASVKIGAGALSGAATAALEGESIGKGFIFGTLHSSANLVLSNLNFTNHVLGDGVLNRTLGRFINKSIHGAIIGAGFAAAQGESIGLGALSGVLTHTVSTIWGVIYRETLFRESIMNAPTKSDDNLDFHPGATSGERGKTGWSIGSPQYAYDEIDPTTGKTGDFYSPDYIGIYNTDGSRNPLLVAGHLFVDVFVSWSFDALDFQVDDQGRFIDSNGRFID